MVGSGGEEKRSSADPVSERRRLIAGLLPTEYTEGRTSLET